MFRRKSPNGTVPSSKTLKAHGDWTHRATGRSATEKHYQDELHCVSVALRLLAARSTKRNRTTHEVSHFPMCLPAFLPLGLSASLGTPRIRTVPHSCISPGSAQRLP